MPKRLHRKVLISDDEAKVPKKFQVLWGSEEADGRRPLDYSDDLDGLKGKWARMEIQRTNRRGLRETLANGVCFITTHTRTMAKITSRNYLEIKDRTARLQAGKIVNTGDTIVEEEGPPSG